MTASGFPTGGRAHPSASGGSLVRSCREKNRSSYRTAQKIPNQHGRLISSGQARSDGVVGKEWWISQNWGFGLAGEFIAASMKDETDPKVTWTASAYSLLFSATYN
jgi:hypothetical protein